MIQRSHTPIYTALMSIIVSVCTLPAVSYAESEIQANMPVCQIDPLSNYLQKDTGQIEELSPIIVNSDAADTNPLEAVLTGNVSIERGDELLNAENVHLDRQTNVIKSMNNPIRYASPSIVATGNSVTMDTNQNITDIDQSQYYIGTARAQGSAQHVKSNSGEKTSQFKGATYSTCIRGSEVWQVQAKQIDLDQDEGRGRARHVKFAIKGQPVLYTPYLSFPTDDRRQTGLLIPTLSMSEESGFGIRVPYYINIAPEMDATVTTGIFTKRGLIIGAEARYLNTWQTSSLSIEMLPSDRQFKKAINTARSDIDTNLTEIALLNSKITTSTVAEDIEKYKEAREVFINRIPELQQKVPGKSANRWSVKYDQALFLNRNLGAHILFQQVSDRNYIKDLDDGIGLLSTTNLERHAEVIYRSQFGLLTARVQDFQVLDRTVFLEDPYSRMPQITFESEKTTESGFQYGINAELVRFKTNDTKLSGRPETANRFDIKPYVGYRFENSAGFINPKLAFRFTDYKLSYRDHTLDKRNSESHSRAMPILSVDSGLVFEREYTSLFQKDKSNGPEFVQTLEPRLYYLYAPYRNQNDLPLFDTDTIARSYSALFKDNRFTGADRQADANQLTTALTTRFINSATGSQRARLSVGQIQYFDAPRVTLGQDIDSKRKKSEWITEAETRWGNSITASGSWHWDPRYSKSTRTAFDIRYKPENRKIINIGYRNTLDINDQGRASAPVKQVDLSVFWEINQNWAVLGRYNYAFSDNKTTDTFLGLEYSDCCIAFRTLTRYSRDKLYESAKFKAYAQIEFIGLGSVGNNTEEMWKEAISGYEPRTRPRLKF